MMVESMAQDQVRANLSPFFHDDFANLEKHYLQHSELILWVANCSRANGYGEFGGFGYFLVTSGRILYVEFPPHDSRPRVYYADTRDILNKVLRPFSSYRGPWLVDLPSSPLRREEIKRREVVVTNIDQISSIKRSDYQTVAGGKQTTLVIIAARLVNGSFLGPPNPVPFGGEGETRIAFYNLQDGQAVYDKLQAALQRDSKTQGTADIVSQLEKLAELYRSKAITDAEYEAAKRKLLS